MSSSDARMVLSPIAARTAKPAHWRRMRPGLSNGILSLPRACPGWLPLPKLIAKAQVGGIASKGIEVKGDTLT